MPPSRYTLTHTHIQTLARTQGCCVWSEKNLSYVNPQAESQLTDITGTSLSLISPPCADVPLCLLDPFFFHFCSIICVQEHVTVKYSILLAY